MTRREDRVYPASFAQERLWFLARLAPGSARHHLATVTRIGAIAGPARLERALDRVVARHEILRTAITMRAGGLTQVVGPAPTPRYTTASAPAAETPLLRIARSDLSHLRSGDREQALDQIARADAERPFTLATAPLLRARLVHVTADDWRLVLVAHRAVCDAASMEHLRAEILAYDAALAEGRQDPLPPVRLQYGVFAVHQRAAVASGAAALSYWRTRLADSPTDLGLPTDRPRPARRGDSGGEVEAALPAEVPDLLARLAERHGTTLFVALLTGLKALLARYTGRRDIVVGWSAPGPVPGGAGDATPPIGAYDNPLVLRTDLAGARSFSEALARVRATVLGALEHAALPFEVLVKAVAPERDPSRSPLYQVSFDMPSGAAATSVGSSAVQRDLEVEVVVGEPPRVRIRYATELFDAATVYRLVAAYRTLLAAAAADPDTPLAALPVLAPADRARLAAWSQVHRWYPEGTLHSAVLLQASGRPDADAVGYEGRWSSYRRLAVDTARTARWLRRAGVGPDVVVGVCLPRGPELVPTLLGVLAAGGAYAPLDPGDDPRRLGRIVGATRARLVVTTTSLAGRLPRIPGVAVHCLDAEWGVIDAQAPDLPRVPVPADALAYVICVPDEIAVGVSHRAILNRLYWMQEVLELTATDRVLHRAPATTDTSVWELFWPLLAGAGLVLATPGRHNDLGYLADLVDRERVTVAHFPPNLLDRFLEQPELLGLDRIVCSGEPLSAQLAARCFERLPGVRLYHCSGPPETATGAAWHPCVPGERTVPAGRPVANARLEVLDRNLRRVPIGAVGELYVGGAQLARGYVGRPGLTAERFVPDPYGPAGARLFRTGDLARWRDDGEVAFLGRAAEQLVVGGVRVEPGQVRAVLERHPNVHRAEVVVLPDRRRAASRVRVPGSGRLAAYVRWTGNPDSLADAAERYLRTVVPATLVPTAFVAVPEFPSLSCGALDRAALPPPTPREPPVRGFVAPRTSVERTLRDIWTELLGPDSTGPTRIGVADDFFALGGDSMLAARLVVRIAEVFGVELPLRRCFELTTIADYALAVLDLQLQQTSYDIDDLVHALQTWRASP